MQNHVTTREAVGVFMDKTQLDKAVSELEIHFPRHDINVLGGQDALKERYGMRAVKPEYVEDQPNAPRAIPVRPEERALARAAIIGGLAYFGGCAAAIATGATANGLTLLGAISLGSIGGILAGTAIVVLADSFFRKRTQRQIHKGGLVLWVRTPDEESEETASRVLKKCGGRNIHIHTIS